VPSLPDVPPALVPAGPPAPAPPVASKSPSLEAPVQPDSETPPTREHETTNAVSDRLRCIDR
jgi:hypothetical protein